jgi:hypothetical protein
MKETGNKEKICVKCEEYIDEDYKGEKFKRYCSLITYERGKIVEEKWFHLFCYVEWFAENAMIKAKEMFNIGIKDAMQQLPDVLKNQFKDEY